MEWALVILMVFNYGGSLTSQTVYAMSSERECIINGEKVIEDLSVNSKGVFSNNKQTVIVSYSCLKVNN